MESEKKFSYKICKGKNEYCDKNEFHKYTDTKLRNIISSRCVN